ncbi:hypothetical protein Ddc_23066 [Ditylenchus destructor]|nr:hypothetical protein Ddc_23066 [Ditylenchus destructor]
METTVNGLSIIFNCYLLYLIQYYSTFGVKVYKYLLTIDAFLDLALGVVVFLGQPAPGYYYSIQSYYSRTAE